MRSLLKKEFLMGIGVGFILSAALLSFFPPSALEQKQSAGESSDVGSANTGSANTGSANTGSANTGSANTGSANIGSADTGSVNTGSVNSGSDKSAAPAVKQAEAPPQVAPAAAVYIKVTSGMGSESVARQLEEKGAVKDQHVFLQVVDRHKAHRRFQNGTFKVPAGGDMEEILYILIGKKRG